LTAEIQAGMDAPGAAVAAIREFGCFVLRGGIPVESLDYFDRQTQDFFDFARSNDVAAIARAIDRPEEAARPQIEGAIQRGVVHHTILSRFISKTSEGLELKFAELLAGERIYPYIEALLGPSVINMTHVALRVRDPQNPEFALPFHQDGALYDKAFMESCEKPVVLIVWIPFSGCGGDRAGLEVVPQPIDKLLEISTSPKTQFVKLEAEVPDDLPVWYPHLEKGDCIIFTETTLHRSYAGASTKPRTSVDLRLFRQGVVPALFVGHRGVSLPSLEQTKL
jgi:ectoine hydroxylase-related dioxygenase (phytanoyl-CoA dioxygenase family)